MDPLVPDSCIELILNNFLLNNFLTISFMDILPNLITIIVLIFGCAFFSGTETALLYCNRQRMKVKAEDGSRTAKLVLKILEKEDKSVITILIGTNVVNTVASTIATVVSLSLLINSGLATLLSTIIMTIVVFVFGEIIPKNLAQANPEKFSQFTAIPLYVINFLLTPISLIFIGLIFLVKKVFRITNEEEKITEDDFHGIVDTITDEGVIDEEESDIINNAVEFGDKTVKDVMTPLDKVTAINSCNCSRNDILKVLKEVEFSRIPIYANTKDNIIGILLVKSYLRKVMSNTSFSYKSCLTEALHVASTMKIDALVDFLRQKKNHIALVTNRSNQVIGLVTMEDALEELIGESDENVIPEEGDNHE